MSAAFDDEETPAEVLAPSGKEAAPRRVRKWGAADIARYYDAKSRAAEARGIDWKANLYIDGEIATAEELSASPPGCDVMVCIGKMGSSATITQFFELAPQSTGGSEAQVVGMASELRQVVGPLISVIERMSAQYIKVIDSQTRMGKMVQKSLKKQLKSHKKQRNAEKATVDAIAEQDKGVSAAVTALGNQLGKEAFERVLTGAIGDVVGFVSKRLEPPPAPKSPPKKRRK